MTEIRFFNGQTVFSNFSICIPTMEYRGKHYTNSEAAFQAAKFLDSDPDKAEQIRLARSPAEAKRIARDRSTAARFNAKEWDAKRVEVMLDVLRCKFQDPARRKLLLDTGDSKLIEESPYDAFWGVGPRGNGNNMLGKLLMQLREDLRK